MAARKSTKYLVVHVTATPPSSDIGVKEVRAMHKALTQARLRELLDYDPFTGIFTWRVNLRGRGGAVKVGKVAGSYDTKGKLQIKVDGTLYFAHRLAFLWVTGEWPMDQVDHINRDCKDNRWWNLREASNVENCRNRSAPRGKHFDLPRGVHLLPSGRYAATIFEDGRQRHLGVFDTPHEAHAVYDQRAQFLHAAFYVGGPEQQRLAA